MTDQPLIDQTIKDTTPADLGEAPSFHTILEVWAKILEPAQSEATAHITPQWANRICAKYPEMRFRNMPEFRKRYFSKLAVLEAILLDVIAQDDEALKQTTPEEDAAYNGERYVTLLTMWQIALLDWELDWNCEDDHAPAELAAVSEVHTMFFSDIGLTALLDQIQFEFSDMHRDALALALQSHKDSREGDGE